MKLFLESLNLKEKNLIEIIALSLLYVLPLLIAGEYFVDDMRRIIDGRGWNHDGRFLATHLMKIFSFFGDIVSLYPYSLVISAGTLLATGLIISNILELEKEDKLKITPLILLTSPFMIENLLYRYDSIPMTLSVLTGIYPYLFIKNCQKFLFHSFLGILISLCLFQSGAMIYFAMFLCFAIHMVLEKREKELPLKLSLALGSFVLAFISYKMFVLFSGRALPERGELIIFESNFIDVFWERLSFLASELKNYLFDKKSKYVSFFFIFISFLGLSFTLKKMERSFSSKLILIGFLVIVFICLFTLVGMPNLVTRGPRWAARTYLTYPFILYGLMLFHKQLKWQKLSRFSLSLLLVFSFILSAQVGTVLKNNAEYRDYVISSMSPYLMRSEIKKMIISGSLPPAPRNELILKNFKIANLIVPTYEVEESFWAYASLNRYSKLSWPEDKVLRLTLVEEKCTYPTLVKNNLYELRQNGDIMIIDFNFKECEASDT